MKIIYPTERGLKCSHRRSLTPQRPFQSVSTEPSKFLSLGGRYLCRVEESRVLGVAGNDIRWLLLVSRVHRASGTDRERAEVSTRCKGGNTRGLTLSNCSLSNCSEQQHNAVEQSNPFATTKARAKTHELKRKLDDGRCRCFVLVLCAQTCTSRHV